VDTLDDWKKTHVLTVKADRLPRWLERTDERPPA